MVDSISRKEIFDYSSQLINTYCLTSYSLNSPLNPTLIGFPITENDVKHGQGFTSISLSDLMFTVDDLGGKIKTFKYTDGTSITDLSVNTFTSARAYSYSVLIGSDLVLIGWFDSKVALIKMTSNSLEKIWHRDYSLLGA